jgi:hypothetical protein
LCAELGKVEIRAGSVSVVHGLGEASLGVVTVEDDAIEDDAEDLDDDLDNDADHGPVLKAADELVVDLVLEDGLSLVVDARPSPHVLVVAVVPGVLIEGGSDSPENQAYNELS